MPAFTRQNCMQLADENARIDGKNTRQTQAKLHPQLQAKNPAIASKNACSHRQSATTPLVSSPATCRCVSLHSAGGLTRDFLAS